ncbi:hypothetical protein DFH08DRAFT_804370 [Mycena albidolilacea]|uniref:Uncharacterized protein n=1 Tax=Mycena albidolilacea TaxID=1033008 RepID=A0AAD7ABV3_9AGAR|nr:hypothetical protein DFH08DRAFT_804370 [Mycena albidolilacea]
MTTKNGCDPTIFCDARENKERSQSDYVLRSCPSRLLDLANGETVHTYLLVTTGLMFSLITARCIIDTYHLIIAFGELYITLNFLRRYSQLIADNASLDLGPPNSVLGITGTARWVLVTVVADMFIVFRTFVVWGRRWTAIIILSLLLLANLVVAILAMVTFSGADTTLWSSVDWMNAFISLTLCTNVVCTETQVAQREYSNPINHYRVRPTVVYLWIWMFEAAIYTAVLVATLVVARLRGFAIFILIDCVRPFLLELLCFTPPLFELGELLFRGLLIHETPTILDQYSSNNRVSRSRQNSNIWGAAQSDFQIKLEPIRFAEVMEGAFSSDEPSGPEGNLKVRPSSVISEMLN